MTVQVLLVVCQLSGAGCSALDVGIWVLVVGYWMLGAGCLLLGVGCWVLVVVLSVNQSIKRSATPGVC